MKTIIANTATAIKHELIELFMGMYGEDIILIEDIVEEALCALNIVRIDSDWSDMMLFDYDEFEEIYQL